jgi:hypothetical protein
MSVVDLKKRTKRAPRDLVPLDDTGAARFFAKAVRDIQSDLGGRSELSRIEKELIQAFAGAATQLKYLNVQIALGDSSALDLAGYSQAASTMLRIGSRLGLKRVPKDVTPTLADYLASLKQADTTVTTPEALEEKAE